MTIRRFLATIILLPLVVSLNGSNQEVRDNSDGAEWVEKQMASMDLREKIGQFFMVAAYSNRGEEHLNELTHLVENEKIGGLIFFQGEKQPMKEAIHLLQGKADVPLLIGLDAEWGAQMRLFGIDRFPYNYTLGATNNPDLTGKMAAMIAAECRELGVHLNFAPVADVNSNPNNPVIGFRSFGENPKHVADHVKAMVKGLEENGIMSSVKHFPGHGDTDIDSHKDLPTITNSIEHIDAIDFLPFRAGIRAGASSVMIGHLDVPALDSSGTPSSLSPIIINDYLKKELNYKGLVISDALNMKAVADRYGKTDVVVKAFEAGCDILLFPESVEEAIDAIVVRVNAGDISMKEIDHRCKKVLAAKYKAVINPAKAKKYDENEVAWLKKNIYEQAITVIRNNEGLPITRFDQKIACISIGGHIAPLWNSMELVGPVEYYHAYNGEEAIKRYADLIKDYDIVITSIHSSSVRSREGFAFPDGWNNWVKQLPKSGNNILLICGNPLVLKEVDAMSNVNSIVTSYENHPLALDRLGQFVMGTFESKGKLPVTIDQRYKRDLGIKVDWSGRLKNSQPEELGISRSKLAEIDQVVLNGIKSEAFPGCQIVVAVDGKIIYKKSFGYHTYDSIIPVQDEDIYDIASVTKIVSSTASVMKLNSEDKFDLSKRLKDYLPELVDSTYYENMRLQDMMSHQAGLYPWIPFYVKTLKDGKPDSLFYSDHETDLFNTRVTGKLWIRGDYETVMYDRILETKLGRKSYKYSDLGYYFIKRIIEQKSSMSLDQYVMSTFYKPMGLRTIGYNPIDRFSLNRIPPTEDDKAFRQELVHGYVHDQGASMMGGVGGHAGIFSNATDLASMMQMFLNKGYYGGVQYIDSSVIDQYTDCQFCPSNRRGAGFDKPVRSLNGGPTCSLVSLKSFGHSGFTGTYAWADPDYNINYVFLSNRVYPDAENWKIVSMGIRTEIQRIIYEAVIESK